MEMLNNTFFYNLEKTVKVYRQFFQGQLKENGFDITLDQWLTLKMIVEYPNASQNEIAEKVFKDKASVARIVELLLKNDYISKTPHPNHIKKSLFKLTNKGLETLTRLDILVPSFRKIALTDTSEELIINTLNLLQNVQYNCQNKDAKKSYERKMIS
jgi:MarR family transcriptional regulator, transcriptional regulator for hemolysin